MLIWLIPVALFWGLAAVYLGGAPIRITGGGGLNQVAGLVLNFAAYLGVYAAIRTVLSGVLGAVIGGLVVPLLVASALIPLLAKFTFRVVGVRITSDSEEAHA